MKTWKRIVKRIRRVNLINKFFFPSVEKKPRRVCRACQKPLKRRHKFFFDGSQVQHKDCSNPTLENAQSAQGELI